jgi:hypothetical protein
VGPRAILDAVVKRKIPSPRRESNPRTPIVQSVARTTFFSKLVYLENEVSRKFYTCLYQDYFVGNLASSFLLFLHKPVSACVIVNHLCIPLG